MTDHSPLFFRKIVRIKSLELTGTGGHLVPRGYGGGGWGGGGVGVDTHPQLRLDTFETKMAPHNAKRLAER